MTRSCEMRRYLGLAAATVCLVAGAMAQTAAPGQDQQPVSTQNSALPLLHVYTDLVQVAALVSARDGARLNQPLAPNRFLVSIGNGPLFRTTNVHVEGDEPISLSILLDVSGNSENLMAKADEAIADLAPELLHTADRVSIYSLDCSLVRALKDVPAQSERLKEGVQAALQSWTARMQADKEGRCMPTVHLRDALASMIGDMSTLPGHRVIVVVTTGEDRSSHLAWRDLTSYAQLYSVAIVGVKYLEPALRPGQNRATSLIGIGNACAASGNITSIACPRIALYTSNLAEDSFYTLCQRSGGSVLVASKGYLWDSLMWVTTMLRERYIVEYPRPANSTRGVHSLEVIVDKGDYTILPTGVSFPTPNQAVLNDPTTIASDPAHKPQEGGRRMLPKPK